MTFNELHKMGVFHAQQRERELQPFFKVRRKQETNGNAFAVQMLKLQRSCLRVHRISYTDHNWLGYIMIYWGCWGEKLVSLLFNNTVLTGWRLAKNVLQWLIMTGVWLKISFYLLWLEIQCEGGSLFTSSNLVCNGHMIFQIQKAQPPFWF